MQKTTASNPIWLPDQYDSYDGRQESYAISDYAMKRLGHKHYAFFKTDQSNWGGQRAIARYKCSHLEARRRFALWLIQRRLMS